MTSPYRILYPSTSQATLPYNTPPNLIPPINDSKTHSPPQLIRPHIIHQPPQRRPQHPIRLLMVIRIPRAQHCARHRVPIDAAVDDRAVAVGVQAHLDKVVGRAEDAIDAGGGGGGGGLGEDEVGLAGGDAPADCGGGFARVEGGGEGTGWAGGKESESRVGC